MHLAAGEIQGFFTSQPEFALFLPGYRIPGNNVPGTRRHLCVIFFYKKLKEYLVRQL